MSSHRAIADPPISVEAPGSVLSYEAPVNVLLFRRTDQPHLPRGARLRWRGAMWTVDQTESRADHVLGANVSPEQARAVVGL